MDFKHTIMDHAVLQRTASDLCDHPVSGKCRNNGDLLLTVSCNNEIMAGFDRVCIGHAARGRFRGRIQNLPTGGAYTLKFEIAASSEKAVFKDILVGDLWLLAGQSNMAGYGYMPSCAETSPMVHAFYMDNRWGEAKDPLHDVLHAAAPVHGGNPANPHFKSLRGTGLGVPFGSAVYKATGVPQGLIACAHGGTSMSQWDPALKKLGGHSLYGALYERLQMLGGRVAGVLWSQGSNETGSSVLVDNYKKNMKKLFKAFRRDCKNPHLPIIFTQMGAVITTNDTTLIQENWMKIRHYQFEIGQSDPDSVCVPTVDLELDDEIHFSNRALVTLGERMAEAALLLTSSRTKDQITLKKVTLFTDPVGGCGCLRLRFGNVKGKLTAGGLPRGFAVVDNKSRFVSGAIRTRITGDNEVEVATKLPGNFLRGCFMLAYGAEFQGHCNIVDEAGRSLPSMLMPVGKFSNNYSLPLSEALVSDAVYGEESIESLKMPENLKMLTFNPAKTTFFCVTCPRESGLNDSRSKVYVFRFGIKLPEADKLEMLFGADSAFVIYCDGEEKLRDSAGNPLRHERFTLPLELSAGKHIFTVVFSSNSGFGWGISCRFRQAGESTVEFMNCNELI